MMMSLIGALFLTTVSFIVVVYAKSKNLDFYLGKGNYPSLISAMSIVAAFTGGGAILNTSKLAETYGLWAICDVLPSVIGLILSALFVRAKFFGQGFSESFFSIDSKIYDRKGVNKHYFIIGFLYILVIAAQFRGTTVFSEAIGVPGWIGVCFTAIVIAAYTYKGFEAVTRTDVLQCVLMLPMYLVILISSGDPKLIQNSSSISQTSMPLSLVMALALPLFFLPISQEIHQRGAASQNDQSVGLSYILAGLFYLLLGSILVFSIAKVPSISVLGLLKGDNPYVSFFMAIGIFSALLSTIDTATNISSHAFQQLPRLQKFSPPLLQAIVLGVAAIIFNFFPTILSLILFALFVYIAGPAFMFISIKAGIHPQRAAKISLLFSSAHVFVQIRLAEYVSRFLPSISWFQSIFQDTVVISLILVSIQVATIMALALLRRVR